VIGGVGHGTLGGGQGHGVLSGVLDLAAALLRNVLGELS
jgi:hypothetical protein